MKLPKIVELAKGTACFIKYQDGNIWYAIEDFVFPIPVSDAGEGSFLPEMKGINLLRWIRKYHETICIAIEDAEMNAIFEVTK